LKLHKFRLSPSHLTMQPTFARLLPLPRISQPFQRSQEGLFHGKMKQYGNNVPHSKHKTRRTWLPNVQNKRLLLEATGERLKIKLTTRALRCIHKAGGLDDYVMKTKADLLGMEGMRLRILVRSRLEEKARIEEEAAKEQRAKEKVERPIAFQQKQAEAEEERRKKKRWAKASAGQMAQNLGEGILGSAPP